MDECFTWNISARIKQQIALLDCDSTVAIVVRVRVGRVAAIMLRLVRVSSCLIVLVVLVVAALIIMLLIC